MTTLISPSLHALSVDEYCKDMKESFNFSQNWSNQPISKAIALLGEPLKKTKMPTLTTYTWKDGAITASIDVSEKNTIASSMRMGDCKNSTSSVCKYFEKIQARRGDAFADLPFDTEEIMLITVPPQLENKFIYSYEWSGTNKRLVIETTNDKISSSGCSSF